MVEIDVLFPGKARCARQRQNHARTTTTGHSFTKGLGSRTQRGGKPAVARSQRSCRRPRAPTPPQHLAPRNSSGSTMPNCGGGAAPAPCAPSEHTAPWQAGNGSPSAGDAVPATGASNTSGGTFSSARYEKSSSRGDGCPPSSPCLEPVPSTIQRSSLMKIEMRPWRHSNVAARVDASTATAQQGHKQPRQPSQRVHSKHKCDDASAGEPRGRSQRRPGKVPETFSTAGEKAQIPAS